MPWIYLIIGVLCDVAGTVALKLSNGCTRLWPTATMLLLYTVGFFPLALALRGMPVSVAYAVWSALGTALVVAIGIFWFKEPATGMKMLALALIITGLVFLNLSAKATN
jgi:small multidrug resistance pump